MGNRSGRESFAVAAAAFVTNEFNRYADGVCGETTYRQWLLLTMIRNMGEGDHSVRDVAEFAGTTRQNAKRMLDPLERRGLVRLRRSRTDARALDVQLTRRGAKYLEERSAVIEAATERVFAGFDDDELDELVGGLRRLMDSLTLATDGEPEGATEGSGADGGSGLG